MRSGGEGSGLKGGIRSSGPSCLRRLLDLAGRPDDELSP